MSTSKRMNQLYVHVVKKTENVFLSIKSCGINFFEESKDLQVHPNLLTKKPIKNAMAVITNINGYRTISVKMNKEGIRKEKPTSTVNPTYITYNIRVI